MGDLSPLPKMNETGQTYFDFYVRDHLPMKSNKRLRKNNRSRYSEGISKDASSLVTEPPNSAARSDG